MTLDLFGLQVFEAWTWPRDQIELIMIPPNELHGVGVVYLGPDPPGPRVTFFIYFFCSLFISAVVRVELLSPVPDSYPSFATLQLVEDGAQLPSINLSIRQDEPSVKASRMGRSRFSLRPRASPVTGFKGK